MAKKEFKFQDRELLSEDKSLGIEANIMPISDAESLRGKAYEDASVGISYFNPDNIPKDYKSLKKEIKFLAETHVKTFIILSHRLKKVRDEELYKLDNYPDFKSFVEEELDLSIRTVYNYLAVVDIFEVQSVTSLKTTNLFIALPVVAKHPEVKDIIFKASQKMSKSEFKSFLGQYREISDTEEKSKTFIQEAWANSMSELISQSKVIRDGMKENTVKRDLKDFLNWVLINEPKNKTAHKMKELFKDL